MVAYKKLSNGLNGTKRRMRKPVVLPSSWNFGISLVALTGLAPRAASALKESKEIQQPSGRKL